MIAGKELSSKEAVNFIYLRNQLGIVIKMYAYRIHGKIKPLFL